MTDPQPMPSDPQPLPGLEDPTAPASDLELAVRRTLIALADQELLEPRHAGLMQLCISMAQAVDAGVRSRRASAAAMAAAQLREALVLLPEPMAAPSSEWDQLVERLEKAGTSGGQVVP